MKNLVKAYYWEALFLTLRFSVFLEKLKASTKKKLTYGRWLLSSTR